MSQGIRINTKNINIRTNPEILELIRIEAKADDIKASRWIRDCLVKELKVRGYHMDEIIPIVQPNKENGLKSNQKAKIPKVKKAKIPKVKKVKKVKADIASMDFLD